MLGERRRSNRLGFNYRLFTARDEKRGRFCGTEVFWRGRRRPSWPARSHSLAPRQGGKPAHNRKAGRARGGRGSPGCPTSGPGPFVDTRPEPDSIATAWFPGGAGPAAVTTPVLGGLQPSLLPDEVRRSAGRFLLPCNPDAPASVSDATGHQQS